jgi:diguanylate cyclase (GGDEF)-like protein
MKRLIFLFATVLGCAWAAWAAEPAPLTTLHAIHALSNAEADKGLPVAFEATVTYFNKEIYTFFVQDDGVGIFVTPNSVADLVPGDRVLIRGKTHGSFRPVVNSESVTLLHHGAPLKPVTATFSDLIHGQDDSILVTVRGILRTADRNLNPQSKTANLQFLTEGGYVRAIVDRCPESYLKDLLDAEVEITGVAGGEFDGKYQMHGVQLNVSSPANVRILKLASTSPWSLPVTAMDQVITGFQVTDRSQRVRVHGTVTYYEPGTAAVLQDGSKSLWIATQTVSPIVVGDVAEASGFAESHNGFLALARGEIQDDRLQAPIAPLVTTREELAFSRHVFDLVSVEGQVVSAARGASQDEYNLMADGQLFTAIYRHRLEDISLPPMKQIAIGSRARVTGICITEDSNPFNRQVPFDILLRTFDDIVVVARPSFVSVRNLLVLVGVLLAIVFVVLARGWVLERRVRRQTSLLALIERRRSRILEDINGTRPLAEIIEEITDLVSFKLQGAPCWCQIEEGAQLGNCPQKLEGLRVVRTEIPAHTGPALGALFVAFDPLVVPKDNEPEALSMAVALTALAIETRRVYSDLLHRSEFDLLTDIHNRFSLAKYLDVQIAEARQKAGIFGLIYIDLDKFKQINDIYGHQVGDLYLQEVALRMKRQLRGMDMLARLGGDEFAVLLPQVRNRARVEEIALRLEHCFNEPFIIEDHLLQGSASIGIALYPKDGLTKDDLLSAADAAMYKVKNAKRATGTGQPERGNS